MLADTLQAELVDHPPIDTPGTLLLPCPECGCELNVTAEHCRCSDCGASWPFVDGIPRFFETEKCFSPDLSISQHIQRCLSEHPILRNWHLQLVGRHVARTSEVLEFKRRDQPQAPTLMIKHRAKSLSREASEKAVTREFQIVEGLWNSGNAAFQATLPRPVALLPEVGAAAYERVPGVPLTAILKLYANCLTGFVRHKAMCRIAIRSGEWLHTFHELNCSGAAPHDAESYLAKLAYWLRQALRAGLDRKTASAVWDSAAHTAIRTQGQVCRYTGIHGDFIPQNIFVRPGGIAVIDFASFRRPEVVYEDIGFFVANCHLMATRWIYSHSVSTNMAAAFLEGYRDHLDTELLNLYVMKSTAMIFANQSTPRYLSRKDARKLQRIEARLASLALTLAGR